jgi:hypothetical protein
VERREELGLGNLTAEDERRVWIRQSPGIALIGVGAVLFVASMKAASLPLFVGAALSIIGGATFLWRASQRTSGGRRQSRLARLWDKWWQRGAGVWFFRLAGLGLSGRQKPPDDTAVGAPTEVVLASAAAELLRELPADARGLLGSGRDVVDHLQQQIHTLREREERVAAALAEAGDGPKLAPAAGAPGTADALVSRRAHLARELDAARREAAELRVAAVAALENVRLQLLRLRAGVGRPSDLTADLEAAREVERQVSAILEARALTASTH